MAKLTHDELLSILDYNSSTGAFAWKIKCGNATPGKAAGTLCAGYTAIRYNGIGYKAQRLAWLYMTGEWPDGLMDHINGVKTDNRFSNLRVVDAFTNMQNQKRAHASNAHGLLGVSRFARTGKYRAGICANGKQIHLGQFDTPAAAHEAYLAAKAQMHQGYVA